MIHSPILYTGSKAKLVGNGLVEMFPDDIGTFYDMFAGSCTVAMNVRCAKRIVVNDKLKPLSWLYGMFRDRSPAEIADHVESRIAEYGLPVDGTRLDKNLPTYDSCYRESSRKAYERLRDFYNRTGDVLDFYTLSFFSFCQQFRFNKGKYNMPFGKNVFSRPVHGRKIEDGCRFFSKADTRCGSFLDISGEPGGGDFVYLDPPYLGTTATYNEKRSDKDEDGWSAEDELDLYRACEDMDSRGVRFGMSNVFSCKGRNRSEFRAWCERCGWKVVHLSINYTSYGKGKSEADEVYVTNYDNGRVPINSVVEGQGLFGD